MKRLSRLRLLTRLKVWESYCSGLSVQSCATRHNLPFQTCHRMIESIRDECQTSMSTMASMIPLEYQMTISLHKAVMADCLDIAHNPQVEIRTRLEAYRLALDCRRYLDNIIVDSNRIQEVVNSLPIPIAEAQQQTDSPDNGPPKLETSNKYTSGKTEGKTRHVGEISRNTTDKGRQAVEGQGGTIV